jgi:hypothetical protein
MMGMFVQNVGALYDNRVIVENVDNANFRISIASDCENRLDYMSIYIKQNNIEIPLLNGDGNVAPLLYQT